MSENSTHTVREVLARLRKRIAAHPKTSPPVSSPASPESAPVTSSLGSLRQYLAAAQTWQNQVGTINPRPPGLHNDLIQVVKKVLRRMLTWYTRPLVQYHILVTQSLTEAARCLETHQAQLAALQSASTTVAGDLGALQAQVHADLSRLGQVLERLSAQLTAQSETLGKQLAEHARLVSATSGRLQTLEAETAARSEQLLSQLNEHARLLAASNDKLRDWEEARLLERMRLAERDVRRILDSPQALAEARKAARAKPAVPAPAESELDYFWLQERFRGDENDVKRKQQIYVSHFRGRKRVVDLGCGRGEFLELMRENGVTAQGVELNRDMVLLCKEKKLDVVRGDLFSFLHKLRPRSVDGIFCAQVIEHLNNQQLFALVKSAHRKLQPGGLLVLETVNPACLMVFARSMYMDLTHQRPIHPETLKFLLESMEFAPVELLYLAPVECRLPSLDWPGLTPEQRSELQRSVESLNQVLFGYQDYAAVARKPAG